MLGAATLAGIPVGLWRYLVTVLGSWKEAASSVYNATFVSLPFVIAVALVALAIHATLVELVAGGIFIATLVVTGVDYIWSYRPGNCPWED